MQIHYIQHQKKVISTTILWQPRITRKMRSHRNASHKVLHLTWSGICSSGSEHLAPGRSYGLGYPSARGGRLHEHLYPFTIQTEVVLFLFFILSKLRIFSEMFLNQSADFFFFFFFFFCHFFAKILKYC
ncbi:hypothetical protein EPR50_G00035130 [Perca flavescens]|uniref:Uncharacterized protein n=1 Tax=Perca flavescens TaxID=8167 RepID=A0A484DE50_PERFV|nr:hypothetical protein EPR50_G00035130 [Perca flavescens]